MVLRNHNDIYHRRNIVRLGKALCTIDCQINDNVCKLFHSLLLYVLSIRHEVNYIFHAKSYFLERFFSINGCI